MKAVLDLGTNSVRLLYQNKREARVCRIGEGVDQSGLIKAEAITRTLKALRELLALIPEHVEVDLLATSALRDAHNQEEVRDIIKRETNLDLQVLSGEEEARLSFLGALSVLTNPKPLEPITVVDVGGGSTELFTGLKEVNRLVGGGSIQLGAVRLLERLEITAPLTSQDERLLLKEIEKKLMPLIEDNKRHNPQTLVAVGGTALSLAAIAQNLAVYDLRKVHNYKISLEVLEKLILRLGKMSLKERKMIPSLQVGREDVIISGAFILWQTMNLMGFSSFTTSLGDLLDGWLLIGIDEVQ